MYYGVYLEDCVKHGLNCGFMRREEHNEGREQNKAIWRQNKKDRALLIVTTN